MTSRTVFFNIIRFFFLVFFQALILNRINLGGYINPYFYIYFILLLPFDTPKWMLLIAAFILGWSVDIFTNTIGLNTAACVMMAFARPFVITAISSGPESLLGDTPSLKNQGLKWFLYYSIILIVIHHFTLFYLEIFRFSEFMTTFIRVLSSSAFTLLLVLISEYILYPRGK
ncbi:MAG: rod shape-determining protein MreD [Bacteroidales bacterium]|nr:rod shape-determining protein MreD [Bacteroidales bacterium]